MIWLEYCTHSHVPSIKFWKRLRAQTLCPQQIILNLIQSSPIRWGKSGYDLQYSCYNLFLAFLNSLTTIFNFFFSGLHQIPLPPVDERRKTVEDVDKDRRYAIDASLVRIMKSRKVLGHQQLVTECVEQMSRMFKVSLISICVPTSDCCSNLSAFFIMDRH